MVGSSCLGLDIIGVHGILVVGKEQALPMHETATKSGDGQLRAVTELPHMASSDGLVLCWFGWFLLEHNYLMMHEKHCLDSKKSGGGYLTTLYMWQCSLCPL